MPNRTVFTRFGWMTVGFSHFGWMTLRQYGESDPVKSNLRKVFSARPPEDQFLLNFNRECVEGDSRTLPSKVTFGQATKGNLQHFK